MSYQYTVNGQKVVLEVDEDLVAVRFAEPAEHSIRAAVAGDANLAPFSDRIEIPEEKFTILPVAQVAQPRHERFHAAMAHLEQEKEVVRVAPVFRLGDKHAVVTDRLLIGVKEAGKKTKKLLRDRGLTIVEEFGDGKEFLVQVAADVDPFAILSDLETMGEIEYVEPDLVIIGQHSTQIVSPGPTGGDPLLPKQYAPQITKAVDAWSLQQGSAAIKIAILDEGVDVNHEDLATAVVGGYDATDDDEFQEPNKWDAHGTACAGLAMGVPNNEKGVRGIGGGCSLLAVRIAYSPHQGAEWVTKNDWIRRGIDWAWSHGADVLSNSWGDGAPSTAIIRAFERARTQGRNGKGCVIVIAANNSSGPVSFPGTLSTVLTVSASNEYDEFKTRTSRDGETWWGSNFGPEVDVAAPGVHNYTTDITGNGGYNTTPTGHYYAAFNGTSAATPLVAGAAALMLSANPALNEAEVRKIICNTADKVGTQPYFQGRNDQMGFGRLNVAGAVKAVRQQLGSNGASTTNGAAINRSTGGEATVSGATTVRMWTPNQDDSHEQGFHHLLEQSKELTPEERELLVEQALLLIDQFYVHLPLKRAMHAVDPLQQLKLLRNRLGSMSERRFHSELLSIFHGLRDLHTNYLLPTPYKTMGAYLPFLIEEYYENGQRRFMASKVQSGSADPTFRAGVTITHWNGIPIERAIAINADRNAGSNQEARFARGLEGMTIRPLIMALPPEEEWVDVRYQVGSAVHELRFAWQVLSLPTDTADATNSGDIATLTLLGVDVQTEASRFMKKRLFAPATITLEEHANHFLTGAVIGDETPLDITKESLMPDNFKFRRVENMHGQLGYIRIYSFSRDTQRNTFVEDFVQEFKRILAMMPSKGLIIDVRGNGGGFIPAGELILQFLTKETIQPEPFHFINTYATQQLCNAWDALQAWRESISLSLQTGAIYSQGFPLTSPVAAKQHGRIYQGPVVLITDALCYSTTDIFAAGFQDHNIGPILGVHGSTGAGGANVWHHEDLRRSLGETSELKPLPAEANFRVSIRQCTRVGRRLGLPVEDLGVIPNQTHQMTRGDLLENNIDLITKAAGLLFTE